MSENKIKWILLGFLIIWGILLLLTSCSVERKTQRKTAWLISHDLLDDVCSRNFPVRDSVVTKDSVRFDTLYLDSEAEILHDTVVSQGDTVFRIIEKKCPPQIVLTKFVKRDSIIYRTNTAEVERLKGVILDKDKQIKAKDDIIINQQEKIDKNDWWKMAFLILAFVNVLGFVFRFFVIKKPL